MRRLATIDLGTNTVRLLVVETEGRAWQPLDQAQQVTRLGEGQSATGLLGEGPARRTADVVVEFVRAAERLGASEIRIVATSAVRDAKNGAEFAARVHAAAGHPVHVVSGEEEARLTLLGVSAGLPDLAGSFLLFDVGGGSTEFIRAESGRAVSVVSLDLGVVPLTERFTGPGPVDWTRYARMAEEIDARLATGIPPAIRSPRPPVLVGTAGTVTTLAALDLGLEAYDPRRVQGHRLSRDAVERQLSRLGALPVAERARVPCLEPGRADVLIAGIAICLATLRRLAFASLVVSDSGLREGILHEILSGG